MNKARADEGAAAATLTPISVAYPDAAALHLDLHVGACRLTIVPGDGAAWVSGSYDDPTGNRPMRISQDSGTVKIWQEQLQPHVDLDKRQPEFTLSIGNARPFQLTLHLGAGEGHADLGGLPLTDVALDLGAGSLALGFSAANPVEMEALSAHSGAGSIQLSGLSNANFAALRVDGGASSFQLDFGGTLRRGADVKIDTSVSSVQLYLPSGTAARVTARAVMGEINSSGNFTRQNGAYLTQQALSGSSPLLTIDASLSLGSLQLHTA